MDLTTKQINCIQLLITSNKTNRDIAKELHITANTAPKLPSNRFKSATKPEQICHLTG